MPDNASLLSDTAMLRENAIHYRPIILELTTSDEAVLSMIEDLSNELLEVERGTRNARSEAGVQSFKLAVKVIVLNLIRCWSWKPDACVGVYYRPEAYTQSRYLVGTPTARVMLDALKLLQSQDYMGRVRGYHMRGDLGNAKTSRVHARQKLGDLFLRYVVDSTAIQYEGVKRMEEVIILKDSSKNAAKYEDDDNTNLMRDNLNRINAFIDQHDINLAVTDEQLEAIHIQIAGDQKKSGIDFEQTRLRRIFNNRSWSQGGRFYHGWWMSSLPHREGKWRRYITINDRPTVEVDFANLHCCMLYSEAGLSIPTSDSYTIEGYERDDVKTAFNIMLNTGKIPTGKHAHLADAAQAFLDKHLDIADLVCSGNGSRGLTYQYVDSQVAEKVMLSLMSENILALPVHDSFIVQHPHKDRLKDKMVSAYAEVMDLPESEVPRVKPKGLFVESDNPFRDGAISRYMRGRNYDEYTQFFARRRAQG